MKQKKKKVQNNEGEHYNDFYENSDFYDNDYEYEFIKQDALKNGLNYSNPY